MEKWEKIETKIKLLNMIIENPFVKRHYEMIHDEDHTPVLFSYTNGCGISVARDIENIDKYLADYFKNMSKVNQMGLVALLGKELFK